MRPSEEAEGWPSKGTQGGESMGELLLTRNLRKLFFPTVFYSLLKLGDESSAENDDACGRLEF